MTVNEFVDKAHLECAQEFNQIEDVALYNQARVLEAFRENRVAARHFSATTGYGYDDIGRDTLGKIYAQVFGTEAALVSPLFSGGTHTLAACLFGLLRTGQKLLAGTGDPYDTLMPIIKGDGLGSLKEYGIGYDKVELKDGKIDVESLVKAVSDPTVKLVLLQRSKGYEWRDALSCEELGEAAKAIKAVRKDVFVMVDNCYGEFTEKVEPTHCGVDLVAGSLIKNIGGGLAPTGGYVAGTQQIVDMVAGRMTAPGIGAEVGSYAAGYQYFYQGLFIAPHVVSQALKGSALAGKIFATLGYETKPLSGGKMTDIIRSIRFTTKEDLIAFCQAVQYASPVDSYVTPEPWDMPGYTDPVIMAAGAFTLGASIELSADGPLRAPYAAWMQGGLNFHSAKAGVLLAAQKMYDKNVIKI